MFEEIVGASPNFVSWKAKLHAPAPNPNHLYFTKAWPGSTWKSDKFFQIDKTAYVDYRRSYTIPGSDYKELDISNATSGLNLYPETEGQVHEILVGFKAGNYIVQVDIPNGRPLGKLPQSSMIPSHTSTDTNYAILKYLNAKNPENSLPNDPTLKFWAVKDMDAIILRPMTLSGQDFERITITFTIAKHLVTAIDKPAGAYDTVPYVTEENGW